MERISKCDRHTAFINSFSLTQKIVMRMFYYGTYAIGIYGISIQNVSFGLMYTAYVVFAQYIFLKYWCSHCPYPCEHATCLYYPLGLPKMFKYNPDPMGKTDRLISIPILAGAYVIPPYWLLKDYAVLILYLLVGGVLWAIHRLHICRLCKYTNCPLSNAETVFQKG
jgi:hypothetical protein